jgi:hypothetical protein
MAAKTTVRAKVTKVKLVKSNYGSLRLGEVGIAYEMLGKAMFGKMRFG